MAYSIIRNGSSGSDVKTWQKYLISQGYDVGSTGADGKFGANTLKATKAYQKANGLTVDGIVGANTWGSMNKNSTSSKATTTTTPTPTYNYEEFKYDPYEKSDVVKQAEAMLQQHQANKPGEFSSEWMTGLNETLDKILNREKFSYDLNGDALYQQYKDQYTAQGKMAMMDTMGQAQAATGGYGNSYAQSVGQQTYQGYLQQLNDRVPELYQLALNQYNQEGQDLYNQYGLYADRVDQDYDMYRDKVSDYYTDLDYLTGRADKSAEDDYNAYMDKLGMDYNIHTDNQEAGYKAKEDANELALSMLGMGVMPTNDILTASGISPTDANAIIQKVKEQAAESGSSGSGGTGGNGNKGNTGGSGYDNSGYSADIVKKAQKFVGASQDGKWGANSTAKAKAMGYKTLAEVVKAMGGGDDKPDASQYADWDAGDWESYFAQIRQSEGKAAAEEELKYFTSNGLIPHKYVNYGAIGARGGQMGH